RDEQLRCGALVAGGQWCRSTRRRDHVTIVGEQELAATCKKMVKIVAARAAEHRSIDAVSMVDVHGSAPSDAGWERGIRHAVLAEAAERRVSAKAWEPRVATDRARIGRRADDAER